MKMNKVYLTEEIFKEIKEKLLGEKIKKNLNKLKVSKYFNHSKPYTNNLHCSLEVFAYLQKI